MADVTRKDRLEEWAKTARGEFPDNLKAAADQLRAEVANLEGDLGQKARELAQDLETVAENLEQHAEKQFDEATNEVQEHPWLAVLVALGIGIIIGVIIRSLNE